MRSGRHIGACHIFDDPKEVNTFVHDTETTSKSKGKGKGKKGWRAQGLGFADTIEWET